MKLKDIFNYLTEGELSQLSIGGGDLGQIRAEDYRKVMRAINLGLTSLFTRFALKEGSFELVLDPDITRYVLKVEHAVSNATSGVPKYINDLALPFDNDLLKIQNIKTEAGFELPFNVLDNKFSCTASSYDVLEVPSSLALQSGDLPEQYRTPFLLVSYRASHPLLDTSDGATIDPDAVEVDLPFAYLEPLLYYVAARIHRPANSRNDLDPVSSYSAKYEQACQRLESTNLDLDREEGSTKFYDRGWT